MNRAALRLAGLSLAALAVRAAWLLRSAEPSGWDGYYYVAQAQHLAVDGHFHVSDPSWVLYLLSLPRLLGADATLGIKLVAALLAAACVPAAFLLGRRIDRAEGRRELVGSSLRADDAPLTVDGPLEGGRGADEMRMGGSGRSVDERAAWWLALWAAGSPALTHLAGDFPKNLGAVAPLLFGLALAERPAIALVLGGVAGWAHRLGAVLALAAAPGVSQRWWAGLVLVLGVAAIVLWPTNAPRLKEAFGAGWPPPPWAYFALRPTAWPEAVELSLAWPALIAGAVAFRLRPERRALIASLWLPLFCCALPLWRTDTLDLGYRLALMAPLFAVPLLVCSAPRLPRAAFALPLALLAVTGFDPHSTPDYPRYRALIAKIPRPLPELLIAHQGINFLYDAETGHEAMAWAPERELDRTKVFRLAWGITDGEWLTYAPSDEAVRLDDQYVYVREDVWERFVAAAHAAHDDELEERLSDYRNPSKLRLRP